MMTQELGREQITALEQVKQFLITNNTYAFDRDEDNRLREIAKDIKNGGEVSNGYPLGNQAAVFLLGLVTELVVPTKTEDSSFVIRTGENDSETGITKYYLCHEETGQENEFDSLADAVEALRFAKGLGLVKAAV